MCVLYNLTGLISPHVCYIMSYTQYILPTFFQLQTLANTQEEIGHIAHGTEVDESNRFM